MQSVFFTEFIGNSLEFIFPVTIPALKLVSDHHVYTFGCSIIDRNISICKKYPEIFFLIPRIANSITKFILLRHIYSF